MSISIGKKIRMIRESEYFTREQFSDLTGIPVSSQKFYETGRIENVGSETLLKITLHPKLAKYTLWLMTGKIAPESGQIEPSASSTYKVLEKEAERAKIIIKTNRGLD
ncbi:helix-turn-helix domain-containing protein [Providencia hangzhouensis]|uniref:helix-turn-helix domain-containing protein n=1 Tax=Providencia hangzhouensis TaxID=3031799 RepID=UPI0034DD7834